MVHDLVHRHGGHVLAESTPRAGACFSILLAPAAGGADRVDGA